MLVFATSDKGGTGRSVTSSNLAYRRAVQGSDVAYLDFDFGSPTAGAIFAITDVESGTPSGGLHSYFQDIVPQPRRLDVWAATDRPALRGRPDGAGQLVLLPGDFGGGEFEANSDMVDRCVQLFLRLEEEFQLTLVDLSAGRSYATGMVLAATATEPLARVRARWIVFHRWTHQHVVAASSLVHGPHGILAAGEEHGHDRRRLTDSIRFVRTAVAEPDSDQMAGHRYEQIAWLRQSHAELQKLASTRRLGRTVMLGMVPLDPVLQAREGIITDHDTITRRIANQATVDAFETIAKKLTDDSSWMPP